MSNQDLDATRLGVLDRMERADRVITGAIVAAAIAELLLFIVAFMLVDWSDRTHKLMFIFSVLGYTIVALGLVALGGHVSRTVGRLIAAIEAREKA